MGGKNELIDYEKLSLLYIYGCNNIEKIKKAIGNIEERIAVLKSENLSGEKGIAYRKAFNAVSGTLNELSTLTEKAAVYMDAKFNATRKVTPDKQLPDAEKNKANYLKFKK